MSDCKNCNYTDEYCASGECTSQSPRNGSQKGDLTSQWKKGELPEGHYYVKDGENMIAEYLDGYFYNNGEPMTSFSGGVDSVLAPVPSYDEWKQLKELLKECELWFTGIVGNMNDKNVGEHNRNLPIGNFEHMFKVFSQKINNALED